MKNIVAEYDEHIKKLEEEKKELKIELLDLRDTNLMFGEIQDMQIEKIKELKAEIRLAMEVYADSEIEFTDDEWTRLNKY